MKQINYRGNIFSQLEKAIRENPTMTIGEIFFSTLRTQNTKGKHYFYMSDQEVYEALERFNSFQEEEDETLDENAFNFWVAQKQIVKG